MLNQQKFLRMAEWQKTKLVGPSKGQHGENVKRGRSRQSLECGHNDVIK